MRKFKRASARSRLHWTKKSASIAAAVVAAGSGLAVLAPSPPAGATDGGIRWEQIQHNIQGAAAGHNGALGYSDYLRDQVESYNPVGASGVEMCVRQFFNVAASVSGEYQAYFAVAKENVPGCAGDGSAGDFGNMLLVDRDANPSRDESHAGYQATPGSPQNSSTLVFSLNANGSEHKRVDCAAESFGGKFSLCTLHTTATSTNDTTAQLNQLMYDTHMTDGFMFMGDFNATTWVINNVNNWRWDTLHTTQGTHANGKIDWVLGRTDDQFDRGTNNSSDTYMSSVLSKGENGYNSDHNLLVAFLRAS